MPIPTRSLEKPPVPDVDVVEMLPRQRTNAEPDRPVERENRNVPVDDIFNPHLAEFFQPENQQNPQ
uniref:Uncharacterized protein n=1 Tax=Bracon brevicornis TaxID=1563983 RepID=A0A6V7L2W8_9HYME